VAATDRSLVVSGLTNGTPYRFTVAATNAMGTGLVSPYSAVVIPRTTPDAPTIGTATPAAASLKVTFTKPASTGGVALTRYVVRAYANGVLARTGTAAPTATFATLSGLVNGTEYTVTVAAANVAGAGPASASSNPVTPKAKPSAVRTVKAVAGSGSATVTWLAPLTDGGSAITGYTVRAYKGTALVSTSTTSRTSVVVSGLTARVAYAFMVTANNDLGAGPAAARTLPVYPTL
jgi:hypothetical protein